MSPSFKSYGRYASSNVTMTGELPANLLRLYLNFDTPMARGQVAEFIHLVDAQGQEMPNAFLNLGIEFWSTDQRRLTILFDPGRLKQGVGPNAVIGPPLAPGGAMGSGSSKECGMR